MSVKTKVLRAIILFAGLTFIIFSACAQDTHPKKDSWFKVYKSTTYHAFGDKLLSLSPSLLLNTPMKSQYACGLYFQLYLSKRFSVNADLMIGQDYYHLDIGTIFFTSWLLYYLLKRVTLHQLADFESDEFSRSQLVLIALVISNVSYTIRVSKTAEISPYVCLLRYRQDSTPIEPYDTFQNGERKYRLLDPLYGAVGVQFNQNIGSRFVVSPYAEYNIGYKELKSGINAGFRCGFRF